VARLASLLMKVGALGFALELKLIIGWATGMAYGTIEAYRTPGGGQAHFGRLRRRSPATSPMSRWWP
jgi:hypothetical protein